MTIVREMLKERVRRVQVHDHVQKEQLELVLAVFQYKEHR